LLEHETENTMFILNIILVALYGFLAGVNMVGDKWLPATLYGLCTLCWLAVCLLNFYSLKMKLKAAEARADRASTGY
jgi:fatty acid desaturase